MNGGGSSWKGGHHQFIHTAYLDGLRGVGRNRGDGGNTKRIGSNVDNLGDFALDGGDDTRDVIHGGGFGQTGEANRGIRANKEGVGVVRNVQIGIVLGGVGSFLVF